MGPIGMQEMLLIALMLLCPLTVAGGIAVLVLFLLRRDRARMNVDLGGDSHRDRDPHDSDGDDAGDGGD